MFAHHWMVERMNEIHKLGFFGILIFFLITILVGVFGFLPSSILGVFGGIMYGTVNGFCICAIAIMCAAMISYWLASFERISNKVRHKIGFIAALDSALDKNGWFIVGVIRLSPVMPFSLASFGLGLTSVCFRDYMLGTLSSLPSLFLFVATGGTNNSMDGLKFAMLFVGFIATIAIGVWTGKVISRQSISSSELSK